MVTTHIKRKRKKTMTMKMSRHGALIIFVKNPQEGKVKTRLAAGIGSQAALGVYLKLLNITRSAANQSDVERYLFYNNEIINNDDWSESKFQKHIQQGGDLGQRMNNAFEQVLKQNHKAVIIGSDCPDISKDIIEEALSALDEFDCVVGPSFDGGYYLLGMRNHNPQLFENIKWSSDSVLESTLTIIKEMGLTVHQLSPLRDIDTIDDLKFYPELYP